MAAEVGALRAVLSLDSAAFSAGLTSAQQSLARFGEKTKAIGAGLTAIGATISAVGAGLTLAAKGAIDRADAFGEFAEKVGIGTEALSRLDYAAKITGVSQDTLGLSLRKLSVAMVAARDGGKQAQALFAGLGVSVTDASGHLRGTEDVLADLADRFADMPPGAEKTAAAMAVFGKSGADMLLMLDGGSAQLRALADEASRFGLVLSDKTVTAAGKFNETLDRIHTLLDGMAVQLSEAMLPVMQALADAVLAVGRGFALLSPQLKTALASVAAATVVIGPALVGIGLALPALAPIGAALVSVAAALGAPALALAAVGAAVVALGSQFEWFRNAWTTLQDAMGLSVLPKVAGWVWDAATAFPALAAGAGGVGEAFALLGDVASEVFSRMSTAFAVVPAAIELGMAQANVAVTHFVASAAANFIEFAQNVADTLSTVFNITVPQPSQESVRSLVDATLAAMDAADAARAKFAGLTDAVSAPLQSLAALRVAMQSGTVSLAEANAAAQTLGVTLGDGLGTAAATAAGATDKMAKKVKYSVDGMGSTFRDVVKGMALDGMTLSSALDRIANKLGGLAIDGLFDGLGSMMTRSGGIGATIASFLGFAKGGVFQGGRVRAFANGGVVQAATAFSMSGGQLGVMGEAGPEAIMPLTRGPGGKLGIAAHGVSGGFTIGTIDARGAQVGVAEQIVAALQAAAPGLIEQSVKAARAAQTRGY